MQTHKIMPKEGTPNSTNEFSKQNVEKIKQKINVKNCLVNDKCCSLNAEFENLTVGPLNFSFMN